MTKRNEKSGLKSHEYNARLRQTKVEGGVTLSYWSVRCRRQGMAGEWGLGWFATRRSAEQAFFDWVAKHRATQLAGGGTDKLSDVIKRYIDHVQTMSARPNTILNRTYTAKQLQQFLAATSPTLPVGKFDAKVFEAYRDWLLGQGYKPQTGVRHANHPRPPWPASVCTAPASNQREPAVELTLLGPFRRVNRQNAGQIGQFGRA